MMIQQVALKGFQSHVETVFNLQRGLNVITGPSDAGKTAIIRAVRWVAFNEPQGEAFVNEHVGEAEVKIQLQNGSIITKNRKKGKTSYVVQQDVDDEGSTFEKSEVPLEVTRLLGIEKHNFGDFETALNFSFQLDAPFLISETASAGAKVLGKLAGTESVDLAIKGVSKDTHATRNMRSQAEKDMERIVGSLFEYQHIDDAKQSLETAEMLFEQIEKEHEKLNDLKEYRHSFLLSKEKVGKLTEKINKLQHVPQLLQVAELIEKSQQRAHELLQLKDDGNRLDTRISSLEQELQTYSDLELAADWLTGVLAATDQFKEINILRQLYQKHTDDVKIADDTLNKTAELYSAGDTLESTEKLINTVTNLRKAKVEYESTLNRLNALNDKFEAFRGMRETDGILTAAESDEKRIAVFKELQKEYLVADQSIKNITERYKQGCRMESISQQELQQAWDEAGGVCPLCESVVCEHA